MLQLMNRWQRWTIFRTAAAPYLAVGSSLLYLAAFFLSCDATGDLRGWQSFALAFQLALGATPDEAGLRPKAVASEHPDNKTETNEAAKLTSTPYWHSAAILVLGVLANGALFTAHALFVMRRNVAGLRAASIGIALAIGVCWEASSFSVGYAYYAWLASFLLAGMACLFSLQGRDRSTGGALLTRGAALLIVVCWAIPIAALMLRHSTTKPYFPQYNAGFVTGCILLAGMAAGSLIGFVAAALFAQGQGGGIAESKNRD